MILRKFLLVLALAAAAAHAHAQEAGRILVAVGDVAALREGREVALAAGAPLQPRDVVFTGHAAAAQIRLTDESILALRANSRVDLAAYRFTGADDGLSEVAIRLLQGGVRMLTGLVGRQRRDRWTFASPVSTLGIRGTGFTVVHCQQDCVEADGSTAPDGTYGVVFEGRVVASNEGGEREFGVDEAFYVPDIRTVPQALVGRPAFLRDRLEARAKRMEQRREAMERAAARAAEVARAEAATRPPLPAAVREALALASLKPVGQLGTAAAPVIAAADIRDADGNVALLGPGLGAGAAFTGAVQEVALVDGGSGAVVVLDGERGKLEQFSFYSGAVAGDRLQAAVLDSGKIDGDGAVTWGRWTDEAAVRVNGVTGKPDTGVHFFFGNLTPEAFFRSVPPGATAVNYAFAGGTRPTNAAGDAGRLLYGLFTVDFLARTITGGVRYEVGAYTYELPVAAPVVSRSGFVGFLATGQDAGRWSCSCSGAQGTIDAYAVSGQFLGSRAQNLGVTYATRDTVAGRTAGASVFRCTGAGCR
jgi:hypothetical protein